MQRLEPVENEPVPTSEEGSFVALQHPPMLHRPSGPSTPPAAADLVNDLQQKLIALYERLGLSPQSVCAELDRVRASGVVTGEVAILADAIEFSQKGGPIRVDGLPSLFLSALRQVRSATDMRAEAIVELHTSLAKRGAQGSVDSARVDLVTCLVASAMARPLLRDHGSPQPFQDLIEIGCVLPGPLSHRSSMSLLRLLDEQITPEDLRTLRVLLESERVPDGLTLSFDTFYQTRAEVLRRDERMWLRCRETVEASLKHGFQGARVLLRCFSELLRAEVPVKVLLTFTYAMPYLARDNPNVYHGKLAARAVRAWLVAPPSERACLSFLRTLRDENGNGALAHFARLTASCFVRCPSDEVQWEGLEDLTGGQFVRPFSPERHHSYKRIADIHTGFANALSFDLARLPGEIISPLVRFGLELGDVQLVHAASSAGFPGPGVVISSLDPSRIFTARSAPGESPFETYNRSWPSLAGHLQQLHKVRVVACRQLLVVQPPPDMRLSLGRREGSHFSLVVFSDQIESGALVQALLVDSAWLSRRFTPCLKEWSPAWSAEGSPLASSALDINSQKLTPAEILAQNTARRLIALDVTSPLSLLSGYICSIPPQFRGIFSREIFGGEAVPRTVFGHPALGRMELSREERFSVTQTAARIEGEVQAYLGSTLKLFDIFRLAHAAAHKGLAGTCGLGVDYSIETAQSRTAVEVSTPRHPTRRMVALAPLIDALKRHFALMASGGVPSDDDPMLVTTNALSYSEPPDLDFTLDLRSLACRIDRIPFSLFDPARPSIEGHTERAWVTTVLPRLTDSFQDLRVIPRRDARRSRRRT